MTQTKLGSVTLPQTEPVLMYKAPATIKGSEDAQDMGLHLEPRGGSSAKLLLGPWQSKSATWTAARGHVCICRPTTATVCVTVHGSRCH